MSVVAQCADDIVVCMRAVTVTPRGWFESVSNLHVVYKSGLWLNFTDWTEVRLQTLPWTQSWLQFYATTGRLAMWDADTGSGHQSWKFTVTRYEKKNIFLFVSWRVFAWIWGALKIPSRLACHKETHCLVREKRYKFTWSRSEEDGGIRNNNDNNNNNNNNNKIDDDYKTFTRRFDALKRHFQEL